MPRQILCVLLLLAAGCRAPAGPSIRVVDFIKEFDRAEKRPSTEYALIDSPFQGTSRPSISGPAPGRIIWTLPVPRRASFSTSVAIDGSAAVRFRVGVSDDRIYEELASVTVPGGHTWSDLRADLSAYAGWKWSVFYRPDRVRWRLVLSADAIAGVPARVLWASPEITTDTAAAREYAVRAAAMR